MEQVLEFLDWSHGKKEQGNAEMKFAVNFVGCRVG